MRPLPPNGHRGSLHPPPPGAPDFGDAAFQAMVRHLTAADAQRALSCCGVPVAEIRRAASTGDLALACLLAHCPGGRAAVAALLSTYGIYYDP